MKKTNRFSAAFAALVALVLLNLGSVQADPNVDLANVLQGSTKQPVKALDRTGLKVILNDSVEGVNLEGWTTKSMSQAETDAMLAKFGVRTVWDAAQGTSHFQVPPGVGRAGVEEGSTFLKLGGKVYKGLTLKGYGGNTDKVGEQPAGSLDLSEAYRDMEISTILREQGVSTYLGVVAIARPGGKANYVRISRTAFRMDSIVDLSGPKLARLVDHLTDSLKDEVGKKLTTAEFAEWLVRSNADVIARKDYIRFQHASLTTDNVGIAEMVDLGDESNFSGDGGLMMPGKYKAQEHFKNVTKKAFKQLADLDAGAKALDFDKLYGEAYNGRVAELQAFDKSRVNLNRATEAELVAVGFAKDEAAAVIKFNLNTPDGIIDPVELSGIKEITRDVRSIVERATTDFVKLSDGSQLAGWYIRGVGGANGVRTILDDTRKYMQKNSISLSRDAQGNLVGDATKVRAEVERLSVERARSLGFERVFESNKITNFSKFMAEQALEVIVRR